jgi:hypothetical protein
MFDAVDEAIKNLLIKEIPIRNNEIEIAFDQPTQDWASRVGNPTLNVYLHEIRENRQLRGAEQFSETQLSDGSVEIRRNPMRVDLHYLVTAWSRKEQDQHHLLGLAMMALMRAPALPKDVLPESLRDHPVSIPIDVVHSTDEGKNWNDFWTTMGNRQRPGITLTVTLLVDPYRPTVAQQVQAAEVRFGQKATATSPEAFSKGYVQVKGEITSQKYDCSALVLTWEEKGLQIEIQNSRFQLLKIEPGTYHLAVRFNDRLLKRHKFTVPLAGPLKIEV